MVKHWIEKFRNAFHGISVGIIGQSSFSIHLPAAALVLLAAWWLRCSGWQFAALGICITLVLSLELMNSAVEYLARGLCNEQNVEVGKALDIASAAVLVASIGAAAVGGSILAYQLVSML